MTFEEILQKGVDEANNRAKSDKALMDVFKQYDGRRIVLNISDDTTYIVSITSKGLSLIDSEASSPKDMYLEVESKTFKKLIKGRTDPLQIMSMMLAGKIKVRNIGTNEIDLVRRILGS